MQGKKTTILLSLILLFCTIGVKGTHIFGGELQYTHIQNNSYAITLTLYGDCAGNAFQNSFANARPSVVLYRGNDFFDSLLLRENVSLREEITPVCPEERGNTSCIKPTASLPGVTKIVYEGEVILSPHNNWRMVFSGVFNNGTYAGRSASITNIVIGGGNGQLMYLETTLNNTNGPNSSPQYTSIPTPFYCINKPQEYNHGAIDADNDSLYFSLVPALITNIRTVTYAPNFNGANPLTSAAGTFNYSSTSGQLSFTPNQVQRSVVVNKVEEYKNGELVGSSMREMTFIVLDNCNNNPPNGYVDSTTIVGGATRNNIVNVCVNTPDLTFTIPAVDLDGDSINVEIKNIPNGASASVVNNGTKDAKIKFSWNTKDIPLGEYNMFITYTDDACPLFSSQTIAYTVRVVKEIEVSHEILKPTNCFGPAHLQFDIKYGVLPRKVTITHSNGTVVGSYYDSTGIIIDSFKAGNYSILAESEVLKCKTYYDFSFDNYGIYPYPPDHEDLDLCLYDDIQEIEIRPVKDAPYTWYTTEGVPLKNTPTYHTDTPQTYIWYINQTIDTCESVYDTVTVEVHDFPDITATTQVQKLCAGDSVTLSATGGISYHWQPENYIKNNRNKYYTYVRKVSSYIVTGEDIYGCSNTDTITFGEIEQCCKFSYPNAFTPNNDGVNDGWRPVRYANTDFYLLQIFNRWGQIVFSTNAPDDRWDGTLNGKKCDIGTYYYMLRAICVAGKQETSQGEFILIR